MTSTGLRIRNACVRRPFARSGHNLYAEAYDAPYVFDTRWISIRDRTVDEPNDFVPIGFISVDYLHPGQGGRCRSALDSGRRTAHQERLYRFGRKKIASSRWKDSAAPTTSRFAGDLAWGRPIHLPGLRMTGGNRWRIPSPPIMASMSAISNGHEAVSILDSRLGHDDGVFNTDVQFLLENHQFGIDRENQTRLDWMLGPRRRFVHCHPNAVRKGVLRFPEVSSRRICRSLSTNSIAQRRTASARRRRQELRPWSARRESPRVEFYDAPEQNRIVLAAPRKTSRSTGHILPISDV